MAEVTSQLRRASVSWYLALPQAFADRENPEAAEFASPYVVEITCAVDEEGTTWQLSDSDTDDRLSYCDRDGIDRPTNFNPEVELAIYRDADRTASGEFETARQWLTYPGIKMFVIKRVGDQDNVPGTPVGAGDKISMQYVETDYGIDTLADEDPAMLTQGFIPKGFVNWYYTIQS